MAGLGEYGDAGFSEYHAKKNPFLITQSLSASTIPTRMNSPMKDFGIFSIPAAIAAVKAAASAGAAKLAATGVGKAVVGAATKLASTKVGGAVVKGVKAVKDVVQAAKGTKVGKFITKATKKPNLGNVAKEGATEGTKSFASKAVESFKKGEIRSGIENVKSTKGYQTLSTAKDQLNQSDAEGEMHANAGYDRASRFTSNAPKIGGGTSSVPEEDLSSVLTYKVTPFKMKGWSPFRSKGKSAAFSAAISSGYSGQVGAIRNNLKNIKFGSKTELGA